MTAEKIHITLLAGGVGGAKMAEGLAALPHVDLSIIGNIADDDSFHGLWVSPDIDTMTYTLAGLIDRQQGWGVADEGHRALSVLNTLGNDTWMSLGDRDFGLHIYRTDRLHRGDRPSDIAADVAEKLGVGPKIILPTDDRVQTRVRTAGGWLSFQEYFVREKCAPEVLELAYHGLEDATPTSEALSAIARADVIVIAPSNPLVSIAPIIDIPGIRTALSSSAAPILAVSPLIAGKVVKGPADRMMSSLGMRADAFGVAERYRDLADLLVIDTQDEALASQIRDIGMMCSCLPILMHNQADKTRLAEDLLALAQTIKKHEPAT